MGYDLTVVHFYGAELPIELVQQWAIGMMQPGDDEEDVKGFNVYTPEEIGDVFKVSLLYSYYYHHDEEVMTRVYLVVGPSVNVYSRRGNILTNNSLAPPTDEQMKKAENFLREHGVSSEILPTVAFLES